LVAAPDPSTDVSIRRAGPDDWEAVRSVRLRALEDAPEAFASNLERELGFDESLWRSRIEGSVYFLALAGSEPCGIVAAYRPEDGDSDGMELVSMWVARERRRSGMAQQLIEAILQQAGEEGARFVSLWVADGNEAALSCYARAGFERTHRSQGMPSAPERCEHQMVRVLP
jgi:ribosomal protein S18 acetylase RimI-like enzyme